MNFLGEEPQAKVKLPRDKWGIFGIVEHILGANRVKVRSMDGKTRTGSIAGKMKKQVWLRIGDIIVIVSCAFQDDKQTSYGGTKVRKLNG